MRTLPSEILVAALAYAERGWPVLPIVPGQKRPLTHNGLLDASTDQRQILAWWKRWPAANVGLRTGVAFDVLDIDGDAGWDSLRSIADDPATEGPINITGRGQHWLYQPTGKANRANLLPKLDWRGQNGYIVAPPSIHPDGHLYAWDPDHPWDRDLPIAPDWITTHLTDWHDRTAYQPRPIRVLVGADGTGRIVDQLRHAAKHTDIVALAHELGYNPRQYGRVWRIHCIFHPGDNEASLTLYPADNSFFCYGCGAWGDSLNLRDKRPGGRRGA